jgi:tRNA pseudouridine55 synthase
VLSGFLNINKEKDITSFGVCNILKKRFHLNRVGHTGTLDPIAQGVLVIAINKATKFIRYLDDEIKEYKLEVQWGIRTDTYDITGKIIDKLDKKKQKLITREQIENIIQDYKGVVRIKIPPFSAKKHNGKPLYKYARQGNLIQGINKLSYIYEIKLLSAKEPFTKFYLKVSRGTYVRSIIDDIGIKSGAFATLKSIIRTSSGKFKIDNAITLDKLSDLNSLKANLINIGDVFLNLKKVNINDEQLDMLKLGRAELSYPEIELFNLDQLFRLEYDSMFLGIAQRHNNQLKILKLIPFII